MQSEKFYTMQLANYFAKHQLFSLSMIDEITMQAKNQNVSLIKYIAKKKLLSGKILAECCSEIFNLPIFSLIEIKIEESLISILKLKFIQKFKILPLKKNTQNIDIGMIDPTESSIIDAITFHTGLAVKIHIINYEEINFWFTQQELNNKVNSKLLPELIQKIDNPKNNENNKANEEDQIQPLIQLVNDIILQAEQQAVSDIHIEPNEKFCRIRYRQYGVLKIIDEIPKHLAPRISTRLKVMAKLDITEKRLPQDGRFNFNNIGIRINTCPTIQGEKIVLRILNNQQKNPDISTLGMETDQQNLFKKIISQPQGMILVTGPTGSGKTNTLYAALSYLNTPEKNISTIEDPIEIHLPDINQINIQPRIGLTFAKILRALLRQDPDIIMIGEIRDQETAEIAIQAAQTGHSVLSTLHTNSAIETIIRLKSMQIKISDISESINLIIAQRLIRTLCLICREIDYSTKEIYEQFKLTESEIIYRAVGCQACSNGYNGRTAIYELLPITNEINSIIHSTDSQELIREISKQNNFVTLMDSGIKKVKAGITTISELKRVINI